MKGEMKKWKEVEGEKTRDWTKEEDPSDPAGGKGKVPTEVAAGAADEEELANLGTTSGKNGMDAEGAQPNEWEGSTAAEGVAGTGACRHGEDADEGTRPKGMKNETKGAAGVIWAQSNPRYWLTAKGRQPGLQRKAKRSCVVDEEAPCRASWARSEAWKPVEGER